MLAGEHREPDQVLRRERIGIWRGVVGGGARPHHQVLGIVGGEEVAAVGGIGIVAIKRALPGKRSFEVGVVGGGLVTAPSAARIMAA